MWWMMGSRARWTRTCHAPRIVRCGWIQPPAARALRSSWERCTREFEGNLTSLRTGLPLLQDARQTFSQVIQRGAHGGQQTAPSREDHMQHALRQSPVV